MSIYALRRSGKGSGYQNWYWDRDEAQGAFGSQVADFPEAKVELFELDAEHLITDVLTEVLDGEREDVDVDRIGLYDPADQPDDITFSELEYRPEGYFYIEMLKASTSEYWPFRVEANGDRSNEAGFVLFDHAEDRVMGVIVPSSNTPTFKASVNGYEADQQFTNLKGAAIHIIREFNG